MVHSLVGTGCLWRQFSLTEKTLAVGKLITVPERLATTHKTRTGGLWQAGTQARQSSPVQSSIDVRETTGTITNGGLWIRFTGSHKVGFIQFRWASSSFKGLNGKLID
jgi:hypothetical protein